MRHALLVLSMLVLITGCKKAGFDRGVIDETFVTRQPEITDEDIQKATQLKPQIHFPIRVAVALTADALRSNYSRTYDLRNADDWRWTVDDKAEIESWMTRLKAGGAVSDIFVISDLVRSGSDLKSLRLAAAKHGADVLLQIRAVAQIDRYCNPMVFFNVLLIPAYLLPSTHSDVLFVMKGAMWDVGNEYLYLAVETEGEANKYGPTLKIKDEAVIENAKKKALKDFGDEFIDRVNALKGK